MSGSKRLIHEIHRRSLWQVLATVRHRSVVACECCLALLTVLGCARGDDRAHSRGSTVTVAYDLRYGTYLGGSGADDCDGIAVDDSGSVYLACHSTSPDFPGKGGRLPDRATWDALIVKLNPVESEPVYTVALNGSRWEAVIAIAVDGSGNAYATGCTDSPDFPTTAGAFQTAHAGDGDIFVVKLDPAGSILYSTLIGGEGNECGDGIAIDAAGNASVTGTTSSSDFPTRTPFQAELHGNLDVFVAKLNPTGTDLVYSTYLGGRDDDGGFVRISVDAAGNTYLAGVTRSSDFPTASPMQAAPAGDWDVFVTKLDATGAALVYSTYLGGSGVESGVAIVVDAMGSAHLTGLTGSADFPVVNPLQKAPGGGEDAFVAKLNPAGSGLVYSTYLGGRGHDDGNEIAVDSAGHIYVAGWTRSADFPLVSPAQSGFGGGLFDAFISKIDPGGSRLIYSTYFGGSGAENAESLVVDGAGNIYITGWTKSKDLVTPNAFQGAHAGGWADVYLAKFEHSERSDPLSVGEGAEAGQTLVPGQIVDLGALGGPFSLARNINNRGEVVGESATASGEIHAFLGTAEGGIRDLGTLGGPYGSGWATNDRGQVVGESSPALNSVVHGFLWEGESGMSDLGGWLSAATSVNDRGQVTGYSTKESVAPHAFVWTSESGMAEIETPGGRGSIGWDIDASGQIVGECATPLGTHACLWKTSGEVIDLGTLGGTASRAFSMNDAGEVVGESTTDSGGKHAFLWTAEPGMRDLGTLGGESSAALGINAHGHVVGYSDTASGLRHAFLWTAEMGMLDLGTLGVDESIARGINDRGEIVGESVTVSRERHATLWRVDLGSVIPKH